VNKRLLGKTAGLFLLLAAAAPAQDRPVDMAGSVRWDRMEIRASLDLDLTAAGIRIPTGRARAEERIHAEYPQLIQVLLLSLPVDSSSTIEDLIGRGEFSYGGLDAVVLSARRTPPFLSADMATMSAAYSIDLSRIGASFVQHSRPIEIIRPLNTVPAPPYTGIIIIASEELPVHGRNSTALPQPCLFPKVWDTRMNLIYERNMLDPEKARKVPMIRYAPEGDVFRPSPSGLSPELVETVGTNPLRIFAREVFGIRPTDPVIDHEDALLILSSGENRRLLREGRVAIILQESALGYRFGTAAEQD
jgi:hypothetical protein